MAKRPSWKKTNEAWKWESTTWQYMAQGHNDTQVVTLLDAQGHHLDRDTVAQVREELSNLPETLARTLSQETQAYWREIRGQKEAALDRQPSTPLQKKPYAVYVWEDMDSIPKTPKERLARAVGGSVTKWTQSEGPGC